MCFLFNLQSLDSFIKTIEDLSAHSNGGKRTEIYVAYEDRESEEKKNLIHEFMDKIKKSCCVSKVPFDDYREDFRCEDIHIFKIVAQ